MKMQRGIPNSIKQSLFKQAGDKCANPGCANWRTHIHHINDWAIYKSHVSADMIAVCPTCHDQIHHGSLKINDDDLYRWKNIIRSSNLITGPVYVEPAEELVIIAGGSKLITKHDMAIFSLSNDNRLTMRVIDKEFLQISSHLQKVDGTQILRVVDNIVRVHRDPEVTFEYQPGHVSVTVPSHKDYISLDAVNWMKEHKPDYAASSRITALDITVLFPGVIKIEGFWNSPSGTLIITDEEINFYSHGMTCRFQGSSTMYFINKITRVMFGFS